MIKRDFYLHQIFRSQTLHLFQRILLNFFRELLRAILAATATPLNIQAFRSIHEIVPFPLGHILMIRYFKLSGCFPITELFTHHGFYNHLLKLSRISLIRHSFWHRKTPHFLVQVLYHTCLTNGVQFKIVGVRYVFILLLCCILHAYLTGSRRQPAERLQRPPDLP